VPELVGQVRDGREDCQGGQVVGQGAHGVAQHPLGPLALTEQRGGHGDAAGEGGDQPAHRPPLALGGSPLG
jgi:hypothetical protein